MTGALTRVSGIPPALRRALAHLPSQAEIDSILAAIDDSLGTLDEDRREAELPTARFELGDWKEGTEMYQNLHDLAIDELLGIVATLTNKVAA